MGGYVFWIFSLLATLSGVIATVLYVFGAFRWLSQKWHLTGDLLSRSLWSVLPHRPWLRWFTQRDLARPDMLFHLPMFPRIAFIGVSHRTLQAYLHEALHSDNGRPLPWETIEIFFADDAIGAIWEGKEFANNVSKHRQGIAAELTSPAWTERLQPTLRVAFFEYGTALGFGGCILSSTEDQVKSLYVVHPLPKRRGEIKHTIRTRRKITSFGLAA